MNARPATRCNGSLVRSPNRAVRACSISDMGDYVPPQVRRNWVAVEEEHNRLLLRMLCWCSRDLRRSFRHRGF